MKPSQLITAVTALATAQRPAFIWGSPGIGKSEIMARVASQMGIDLIDVRAVLMDPVDLRGLPIIDGDYTKWSIPSFLPRDGRGILFLDELNAAPQSVQAACYQLIHDRQIGDYTLPEGWTAMGAGNRQSDRAAAHRMISALANRFVHLDLEVDADEWVKWAISADINPMIVAMIRFKNGLLHNFNPSQRAFPTPRTWSFVSSYLDMGLDDELLDEMIAGTVGEEAATEFSGYRKVFKSLPQFDSIILAPDTAQVPSEPSALFAVSCLLARKTDMSNLDTIGIYLDRLPDEFSAYTITDLTQRDPTIVHSAAWTRFATSHTHLFH